MSQTFDVTTKATQLFNGFFIICFHIQIDKGLWANGRVKWLKPYSITGYIVSVIGTISVSYYLQYGCLRAPAHLYIYSRRTSPQYGVGRVCPSVLCI